MRIGMLALADSVHTIRWANAFSARGHEVHLLSSREPVGELVPGVTIHQLRVKGPLGYFLNAGQVRRILSNIKPDVLNTHFASGYGTLARLVNFRPNVLSVWGSDVYAFPAKSRWHRQLVVRNLRAADFICSTSKTMAEHVKSLEPNLRMKVVPFGIDAEKFSAKLRTRDATVITIGTVKTLAQRYGIDLLLRAFALVLDQTQKMNPALAEKLQLKIVGGGPDESKLKILAEDLDISHRTIFTGAVPHDSVPGQLQSLDIYVALSREESFGVAVLEASACGIPVVVSDVGGLPEIVQDEVTGFVVAAEDVAQAAQRIRELVYSEHLRDSLGRRGQEDVRRKYDWWENVSQMEEVLRGHVEKRS